MAQRNKTPFQLFAGEDREQRWQQGQTADAVTYRCFSHTEEGVGVGGGMVGAHMGPFLGEGQEMKVWKLMSMYNTVFCGMQQAQSVIRYPLLLGGNECLEAWGNPEAQLVEERRL